MAFSDGVFAPLSSMANTDAGKTFTYKEDAPIGDMQANSYFNDAVGYGLADGDVIMIFGNDGFAFISVVVDANNDVTVDKNITA